MAGVLRVLEKSNPVNDCENCSDCHSNLRASIRRLRAPPAALAAKWVAERGQNAPEIPARSLRG